MRKRASRVDDILAALEGAFARKGWHGPTVLQALEGVSAREASLKPCGAHHSIHELVDHIQYWEEAGLRHASTRHKPKRARRDWSRPTMGRAPIAQPPGTWDSGIMPLGTIMHGVAAHDAYHAGQIRLLRTLK